MGSYKTKKDNLTGMIKSLKLLDGQGVEVGVLKGEHAWLAAIHEYGCDITVTPKMRAYLHSRGLHLRKTTTSIHIPERSFLRTGYDQNRDAVLAKANMLLTEVVTGRMSARGCKTAVGMELASKIKDHALAIKNPPNHPFTTDQKGSSNPLVDTGDMIASITWRASK